MAEDRHRRRPHPYNRPEPKERCEESDQANFNPFYRDLNELMKLQTKTSFKNANKERSNYDQQSMSKPGCRFYHYYFRRSPVPKILKAEKSKDGQPLSSALEKSSSISYTKRTHDTPLLNSTSASFSSCETRDGDKCPVINQKTVIEDEMKEGDNEESEVDRSRQCDSGVPLTPDRCILKAQGEHFHDETEVRGSCETLITDKNCKTADKRLHDKTLHQRHRHGKHRSSLQHHRWDHQPQKTTLDSYNIESSRIPTMDHFVLPPDRTPQLQTSKSQQYRRGSPGGFLHNSSCSKHIQTGTKQTLAPHTERCGQGISSSRFLDHHPCYMKLHANLPYMGGNMKLHANLPHMGGNMKLHANLPHMGGNMKLHANLPHMGGNMKLHAYLPHMGGNMKLHAYLPHIGGRWGSSENMSSHFHSSEFKRNTAKRIRSSSSESTSEKHLQSKKYSARFLDSPFQNDNSGRSSDHDFRCSPLSVHDARSCTAYREHQRKARALLDFPLNGSSHDIRWSVDKSRTRQRKSTSKFRTESSLVYYRHDIRLSAVRKGKEKIG